MKRIFCVLTIFTIVSPVWAAGDANQPLDKTAVVAAASYVDGAYNAMDAAKQDKLSSENVIESGGGAMVMDVSATNGVITVTKSEVTIPVGDTVSSTRATIWLE